MGAIRLKKASWRQLESCAVRQVRFMV